MADIFTLSDARSMLKKKRVLFLGDSNIRAIYKDLICLIKSNSFIRSCDLKSKLEPSFKGDKLLEGSSLTRGRSFQEHRQFKIENVSLEFYFLTRSYSKTVEDVVTAIKEGKDSPADVIVMNSCLWDLSRWGPNGVCAYKDNLLKLMKFLNQNLPQETLFIWTTALPISQNCYGGFLIKQVEFLKHTLRFEVMEANMYARDVVANHGYDVLDLHYYFTMQIFRRAKDGIHWLPEAVRFMTNLVLTHTALSWHHPLPGNMVNSLLDEALRLDNEEISNNQLPELPPALDTFSKTSKEPDGVVSGRKSQVQVALRRTNTRPAVLMQKKPARKRKSNRQNMKRQQCQALLVDPWINASHTPHPFGDPATAADLMLFDQQVHDFFTHQRMPHHVSQMGRPAESYTSSELEQFEWEHY